MGVNKSDILIIIVFYNPTAKQVNNANSISEFHSVFVADNSNIPLKKRGSFIYKHLGFNKGIAAAQNVGIKYARENGFKYVLLLDQDSRIDESFVSEIYRDFITLKESDCKVAFVGPIFVDEISNLEYKNYSDKNKPYTRASSLIASGCLISMESIEEVGGMDERLFIDLVDFEWCWRAESKGYTGYMTRNVKMIHSIGNGYHNWHGFVLGISAPFRYYYQYRNTLWLTRREYVPLKWKIKSILRRGLDMLLVPLFSHNGKESLKYMKKGIIDGLNFKKNSLCC